MVENDKIPACHRSTESGWVTTGAELPGSQNNDPSNTASDVLSAEQNACLIALRTSQTASLVVPIVPRETCLRDLLENSPRRHPFSTVQRDTHVVEETLRVAYDQGQRMRSMSSPHNTGAVYADRVSVKRDALPSHDTDNTDPEPSPKSPCLADSPDHTHRLTSPEPSTLTGKRALSYDMEPRLI